MFFLSGITGKVGGATARVLLDAGHAVRGLVRDPAKAAEWVAKGVEVRRGDLNDAAALAEALEGVEGAFVMMPPNMTPQPGYPESKAIVAALREALEKAKPGRVVALSSIGSEKTSGLGLITGTHLLEEGLKDLPCPTAMVRAGSFIENALGGLGPAEATGVYYSFYQPTDLAVPSIATVDIGAEVAKLLTSDWSGKRIIELGSPVTADEMAAAMGEVLGREVKAQAIPREQWANTFEGFGLPKGSSWAYEEMLDGVNSGWIDFGVEGTEAVAGTTTPAEVFAKAREG
jgi:uncharacterized protein YbjT (DUF2867 family)